MSTSLLYHRFGIVGYRYVSQDFISGATFFRIEQPRERLRCSDCGSDEVHAQGGIVRRFLGLPIGKQPTFVEFKVPRVLCWKCGLVRQVKMVLPGLSWVKVEAPAIEVDGGFVVFDIAEAADASFDGHDLAVDSFSHAIGDFVRAVADDVR